MTNTRALSLTAALAVVSLLSACGGGGSGISAPAPGGPGAPADPTTPALVEPASMKPADLIAFAKENNAFEMSKGGLRFVNSYVNDEGQSVAVSYEKIAGSANGLIYYTVGNEGTYRIHAPATGTEAPVSGYYTGDWDVSFQTPGSTEWKSAEGEFGFEVDMATGELFAGGFAGNGRNSVEAFADGRVTGDRFTGSEVITVLRDEEGSFLTDDTNGSMDGLLVNTANGAAGFGTVSSDNGTGFVVNSGFSAIHQPGQ